MAWALVSMLLATPTSSGLDSRPTPAATTPRVQSENLLTARGLVQDQASQQRRAASVAGCMCPPDYHYCGGDHHCYSSETNASSMAHGNSCGAEDGGSCTESYVEVDDSGCMCPSDYQYCGVDHHCHSSLTVHSSWAHGSACGAEDGGSCTESYVHSEHPAFSGSAGCVCPSEYHYCGPNHWCYSSETDPNSWAHGTGCGVDNGMSCSASHPSLLEESDDRAVTIILAVLLPILFLFIVHAVVRVITGKKNAGAAKAVELKDPYDVAVSSAVAEPDVEAPISADEAKPAPDDVAPQPPKVSDVLSLEPDVPATDEDLWVHRDELKQAEMEADLVNDDDSEISSSNDSNEPDKTDMKNLQSELVEMRAWKKSMEDLLAGAAAEADAANVEVAEGAGPSTPFRV